MKRPSIVSDAAYNTASFAVRMLGVLITLAWVARALGPEGQGRFGFAHWVAAITGQVAVWGLGIAMTRFVARELGAGRPSQARATVALAAKWLHPTALGVLAIGLPAAAIFGGDLRGPLLAAIPYSAAIAWVSWRVGVAHGLRRFDIVFWGDLLYWSLLLWLLPVGLGAEDPIVGAMLTFMGVRFGHMAVVWLWTDAALRGLEPPGTLAPAPARHEPLYREVRSYALQMALVALFGAVLWERSELAFLKAKSDYEQIGYYTAAFGLSILVIRVPGVLGQIMLPFVAGLHGARSDSAEIGAAFRRGSRLLSLVMVGPVAILIASAPTVVTVMFDEQYRPAAALLRILLVPLLLGGVGATGAQTLVGGGGHGMLLKLTSWVASLKMWLLVWLVPAYGAVGAAIGCALAQGIGLAAEGAVAARRFPVSHSGRAEPSPRWLEQAAVGVMAAAATLGAGWLVGGASRGTDPLLALSAQLFAGLCGMVVAALIYRPLPAQDAELLATALPAPIWARVGSLVERIAERRA